MTRVLLAVVFGLSVLSIGADPSFADGRRDRHWDRQWDRHWDRQWDRRSYERHRVLAPRFHHHRGDEWRRGRWHHGYRNGRNGWWWVIGSSWYFYRAPVYPYPAPVYHYPAPVYHYPPAVAAAPAPFPVRPQASVAPYCREYQGDAIIDGTNQRFYGTACLQPDGAWHIVP